MELKSMERTKKEKKNETVLSESVSPDYPWGLGIRLDEETIQKLGIAGIPEVGQKIIIYAKAEVRSVSMHENAGGEKQRNVELQITDMAIGPEQKKTDYAKVLYGG